MTDITYMVIDDLNNGLDPDEHVNPDIIILKDQDGIFYVNLDGDLLLITDQINTLLEYVITNLIVKGEM